MRYVNPWYRRFVGWEDRLNEPSARHDISWLRKPGLLMFFLSRETLVSMSCLVKGAVSLRAQSVYKLTEWGRRRSRSPTSKIKNSTTPEQTAADSRKLQKTLAP
jgi:hypothetical protein